MDNQELIIGEHSILSALQNPRRYPLKLFGTKEGLKKHRPFLKSEWQGECSELSPQGLDKEVHKLFNLFGHKFQRVPSQAILVCQRTEILDQEWVFARQRKGESIRLVALDRLTDMHNAAAVLRTAAFYAVDGIIIPQKNSFSIGPSLSRIASGGLEYTKLISVGNLSRFLNRFEELGGVAFGMSEHAENDDPRPIMRGDSGQMCIVLGAEDKGLSHAVKRSLKHFFALRPQGPIQSLNVSVAAALSMQIFFGRDLK